MSVEQIKNSSNIKKTTVTIDNDFKTSGTNTNFVYDLSTTIADVRLIEVKNIELNFDAYNINERSNLFNWTDQLGITHDIELLPGNRSSNVLCRELQDHMNDQRTNNSAAYMVIPDKSSDTIIITTYDGITTFDLNFATPTSTMADSLGFSVTNFTGSTQYEGILPMDLIYTENIFVGSTNLMLDAFDTSEISNGATHVLTKMEINADYGDTIFYEPNVPIRNKINSLSSIDIRLLDDSGQEVLLPRGGFKITFDIYSRLFNNGFSI